MTSTRFEALGAYLPENRVSTEDLVSRMAYVPPFNLADITGIKGRRVHDKSEGAFEDSFSIAKRAAEDCLSRSRYRAADLDVIISVSISRCKGGYRMYLEPSFGLLLAHELGANSAIHFDISNACAGMISGVYMLDSMIKAGVVRNGMVVSGECITPIADTAVKEIKDPYDFQFGSLTVGDAGTAVILDRSESESDRIHYVELTTCAEHSHLCIGQPSDQNDGLALYTNNVEMHKEERIQLWPRFHKEYLASQGKTFDDEKFDYLIHHQVGARAVHNFSKWAGKMFPANMPPQLTSLEEYGNTATTSHFLVLYDHLKKQQVKKGAKILLVPAASGVVTGALSVTITSLEV